MNYLFPFQDSLPLYIGFTLLVLGILYLDLKVFHRSPHQVKAREALAWSLVWVALALVFNVCLYFFSLHRFLDNPELIAWTGKSAHEVARQVGLEFLTGYIVEKCLALDNLFVFVVIFQYFNIPEKYQHRILFLGILGALFFRAVFIALGALLLRYEFVIIIFGIFLIFTGIKVIFTSESKNDLGKNHVLRFLNRILPVTSTMDGERLTIIRNGRRLFTPLFVALVLIEVSDIIFAVDSVPAIYAITSEPFLVFTSNILAILGLRSLYFLLARSVDVFHLLKYGLGAVLIFIGIKMSILNEIFEVKLPIYWSLIIILSVLSISIVMSLVVKPQHGDREN